MKRTTERKPLIKFRKKRVWKWPSILCHRFFDPEIGFFTVQKAWHCKCWRPWALTPDLKSRWFYHYTIQIRTEHGEKLIMHKLPFDLKGIFDEPQDKKGKAKK